MSAVLSDCGTYRYALWRDLGEGDLFEQRSGTCLFVMLNPSVADAEVDDPTIGRCMKFARRWGFRTLAVGNVYAFRATDPKEMLAEPWPIGEPHLAVRERTYSNENDEWLRRLCLAPGTRKVIAAWGNNADPIRARQVADVLTAHHFVQCLGTTASGAPKHPLARGKHRVPDDFEPIHFDPYAAAVA